MKVKITTRYNWRESTDEYFSPSDDGTIIVSRDIPASAYRMNLQVGVMKLNSSLEKILEISFRISEHDDVPIKGLLETFFFRCSLTIFT